MLHRPSVQARQILRKLLLGRLVFTPKRDGWKRLHEFAGQASLGGGRWTRASQIPSQARLSELTLKIESAMSPEGFISK